MLFKLQGSVVNRDEVEKAFKDVDCVYHMASYGMSGREQVGLKPLHSMVVY